MHAGRAARALAAVAIAVAVAGCTSAPPGPDEATPSPSATDEDGGVATPEVSGERVAVVVPPAGIVARAEAAALVRAARELAESPPQGIAQVRVTRASSPAFVRDLAELAVDDGYDLVCVVGTGAAELVLELARARREARFCTTDGRVAGGPVNLVAVAVDPAALVEAAAVAIGTAPAPVGFLASPQVGDVEELTAAFTATVAPPRQAVAPSPGPSPSPTGGAGEATGPEAPPAPQPAFVTVAAGTSASAQASAADELAAGRPSRAVVLATPGGTTAAVQAATTGAELVVVADWAVDEEGALPANLLVGLTMDWAALLGTAIEAGLGTEAPQVQLLGVDAGVLGALPGQVPEAAAAADRTNEHLRRSEE